LIRQLDTDPARRPAGGRFDATLTFPEVRLLASLPLAALTRRAEVVVTLTWNGKRFDWVNVGWFATLHAGALLAPWTFTWTGLAVALVLWWLSGSIGICFTYHRLLTHAASGSRSPSSTSVPSPGCWQARAARSLGWRCTASTTRSPTSRARTSTRRRTAFSGATSAGCSRSSAGATARWNGAGPPSWWRTPSTASSTGSTGSRTSPSASRSTPGRVVPRRLGVCVRLLLTVHGTWFVNSAAHTWGYRTWRTKEDSRNLWWVGLVAWGEGWHNTHHAFQRSARHGFGWELDTTWLVIRALAAAGLATDIHLLPKNAERFRIRPQDELEPAPVAA